MFSNSIHIKIDYDKYFNEAVKKIQQENYFGAYKDYIDIQKKINELPLNQDELKINNLRCELGILACELRSNKISFSYARNRIEKINKELLKIAIRVNDKFEQNECNKILTDLDDIYKQLNYHIKYSTRLFNYIFENKNDIRLAIIENAIGEINNILDYFKLYNLRILKNKSQFEGMAYELNKLYADRLIKASTNNDLKLEEKINYLMQAIDYYKQAISKLDHNISSYHQYASKLMPLHFGILHAYNLLAGIDVINRQQYSDAIILHLQKGDETLGVSFKNTINKLTTQTDKETMAETLGMYNTKAIEVDSSIKATQSYKPMSLNARSNYFFSSVEEFSAAETLLSLTNNENQHQHQHQHQRRK